MSAPPSNTKRRPILGCIADDVTGATDLAINLVQGGMCVVQLMQIPTASEIAELDADAVVVALKTRSIQTSQAVEQSIKALRALRDANIERFFFKYCSTFDSTPDGNIGQVAGAMLDETGGSQTIFCPAFPRNGRTVYAGHLFVHGKLLNESGMQNHPLNPMTDANLVRWLGRQTERKVGLLAFEDLKANIDEKLSELSATDHPFVVVDSCDDEHLRIIATAVSDMGLVTGGSGIARYLPNAYRDADLLTSPKYEPTPPNVTGRVLMVAGSCSTATNAQVAWMADRVPTLRVDVNALMRDAAKMRAKLIADVSELDEKQSVLIASSSLPEQVDALQAKYGRDEVATAIENLLADVTHTLVSDHNFRRLVLAGGETSGAIVNKLGVRSLRIGPEICPGVPWTETTEGTPMALALKSGNFGSEDFFERAMECLS